MCMHSIDDLLPHAPLHCAATGEVVKCSYIAIAAFVETFILRESLSVSLAEINYVWREIETLSYVWQEDRDI